MQTTATLEALLIADDPGHFRSRRVAAVDLDLGGIPGDRHHGVTMRAGVRQPMYPKGAEIRNRRQLSAVSVEELAEIAARLDLPAVEPEWLGANLLLVGLPDLSHLPAGSRLLFPSGAGLVCEGRNEPCVHPGEEIARVTGRPDVAHAFVRAARHRRGVVLTVERPGRLRPGMRVTVLVPEGPSWSGEPAGHP